VEGSKEAVKGQAVKGQADEFRSISEEAARSRALDLSYRGLVALPPFVTSIAKLVRLDLSHNCLQVLPLEIGELKNLRELWLSHNGLEELPPSIGMLLQLRSLDLQYNQLNALPESIGRLEQLVDLDLRNNPLTPKLAKRLFKKGEGRILVKQLKQDMFTCVYEDLGEILAKIGQRRYDEDAKRLTDELVDEFGGSTAALAKLVRNAETLVPSNLSEAEGPKIKSMFDARFQEAKGTESLSNKKKITSGYAWLPTGAGTAKKSTYGDEFWSPDGIW